MNKTEDDVIDAAELSEDELRQVAGLSDLCFAYYLIGLLPH